MAKELTGLEYLKKNEIKNMKCKMSKPFAFISYSHDEHDSQIVMNVFKKLMIKGYNLWIDTANMPVDENEWRKPAIDAMMDKNCKFAFFFRSENSMIKETIAEELETLKMLDHIKKIATIDIWENENMSALEYYKIILNRGGSDFYVCNNICKTVSRECKAIRLISDAGNDILSLVEEMEDELKNNGISPESKEVFDSSLGVLSKEISDMESMPSNVPGTVITTVKPVVNIKVKESNETDDGVSNKREYELEKASIKSKNVIEKDDLKIWKYIGKGADALIEAGIDDRGCPTNPCKVLKGSRVAPESDIFKSLSAFKLKRELENNGIIKNDEFVQDYQPDTISKIVVLIYGCSVSMPDEVRKKKLFVLGNTTAELPVKENISTVTKSPKELPLKTENNAKIYPIVNNDELFIWKYTKRKSGSDALIEAGKDERNCPTKKCKILAGSKVGKESLEFMTSASGAYKLKRDLENQGIIQNGVFLIDYESNSISTVINLLCGGSESMPREVLKNNLRIVGGTDDSSIKKGIGEII